MTQEQASHLLDLVERFGWAAKSVGQEPGLISPKMAAQSLYAEIEQLVESLTKVTPAHVDNTSTIVPIDV